MLKMNGHDVLVDIGSNYIFIEVDNDNQLQTVIVAEEFKRLLQEILSMFRVTNDPTLSVLIILGKQIKELVEKAV
jgi:hypothetical protein